MKKIILTGAFVAALVGTASLQSCNSEKKADTADTTTVTTTTTTDSNVVDTTKVMSSSVKDSVDTGGKGTLAPPPKK
ncbi:hypothetical protein DHW03_11245 [Pedobacter yonginense]|uniref:Coproporphyrinogen III oxidase n=1 Tax=Pedobacter yonginense TaxID=651869 RepID=A0A317EMS9_9SPHI|nr:hypothetical protein [Pedobacter yonginense]PWS28121.1 hypothetical protein DHW03_11245 [Pedobacter yonginense]